MSEGMWAAVGALLGGSGLAVINKLLGKNKEKFDLGAAIREEIRKDNLNYRNDIEELERRIDSWSKKYYEMDEAHKKKIAELEDKIAKMRRTLIENGIEYLLKYLRKDNYGRT